MTVHTLGRACFCSHPLAAVVSSEFLVCEMLSVCLTFLQSGSGESVIILSGIGCLSQIFSLRGRPFPQWCTGGRWFSFSLSSVVLLNSEKTEQVSWNTKEGVTSVRSWHFPAATRNSHVSLRPCVPTWPWDSPHTLASCSTPPHLPAVVMWLAKWPTGTWMFGLVLSPVGGQVALGEEIQSSVLVPVGPICPFVLAVKSPWWLFWTQT